MKQRWVIGLVAVSLLAGAGARSSARAAWSGFNGRIAFMAGERALYSIAPDGSDRQTLLGPDTADSHSRSGAVWSRDGSAIALTQANPDADHRDPDLFVIRGGQWHDLTNWTETDAGRAAFPTWSPDGSQLMFLCSPDQSTSVPDGICRVSAAGGPVTLVVAGDFLSVAWSPDGKKIAYSDFGSPHDLYVANVDGTHPEIVGNALAGLDWSPDGTHLAGNDDDAVESVDIADHSASYLDAGSQPSWSPDGKSIAFDAVFGQSYDLVIASADGSDARLVEDPATGQPIAGMQPRWLIGQPPPRPNPPAVTGRPSITGTAKEGSTLTAGAGAWNGDPPITYAYQWQRCDTNGANCTTIDGATNGTYAVATADIGHTLRVDVTASNAAGHASSGSDATGIVVAAHVPPRIARIHARRALGVVHLALTACTDSASRLRVRTQTRAWTLPAAAGCRSISESWRAPRRGRLVIVVRVTDDSGASSAPVRMTLR